MGTSSTFSTSNTHVKYNITVNQNSQNVSNNCSNVSVYVRFWRDNQGYTTYGSGTCYCKINGTTYSATVSPSQKITDSGINLFSKTLDIYHNNDGTKTLTCSAWISMDTPLSSSEQSYSQTLSTIPRASKPTLSSSSVTMGNSVTISTNRASSSFTHSLYYQIGSGGWNTIGTGIGTSKSWTVPLSLANSTPNSTSLSVKLWLETYNGSTYIGANSVSLTANVPSSVVPTINSVNLSEAVSGIYAQFGAYVQGKSKISGSISASGSYSSTISSYSTSINGVSYTSSSFTTGFLTTSGSNTCLVTVKDSRGRTKSQSVTFNVIAYANPAINSFSVSRCDQDGTANDEGDCAKCVVSASISSVNNGNTKSFQIKYKKISETEWNVVDLDNTNYMINTTQIIQNIDTESEYNFKTSATDFFSFAEYSHNLSTAYTLVDYNQSGKGMAIGKVSTQNAFEINMDTKITGGLTINNKTIFDLVYPVGSIYMSVSSTNPGSLFGGTWTAWGQGRVPVGVNTSGTFNSVEKTGGSETHKLTVAQMPSHTHTQNSHRHNYGRPALFGGENDDDGSIFTPRYSGRTSSQYKGNSNGWTEMSYTTATNQNTGGGEAHNNLQPYITCYMWKRTA